MNREFWLDGFNFFHCWEATRALFRPDSGLDIVRALERSLRALSRRLAGRRGQTLVFLDGGLSWSECRVGGLRVRYCGPGNKADDRMLSDLDGLGSASRRVIAVSNDRELRRGLGAGGASCLGVAEFLCLLPGGRDGRGGGTPAGGGKTPDPAEILREKTRSLSAQEVRAWVDYFGGDLEI